jgi:hypothetical protein
VKSVIDGTDAPFREMKGAAGAFAAKVAPVGQTDSAVDDFDDEK